MRGLRRHRQRGVALLVLAAIAFLAVSYVLVTGLNRSSSDFAMAKRERNMIVLNRTKQALIGWIALQAAKYGETQPGRLPCPEDSTQAGSATEGSTGVCGTGVEIGRLPWRSLGMDKPVDADGEALWIAVSAGWVKPITANLVINSNTPGTLDVDGIANAAIAVLIAPGAALTGQTRTATGVNYASYLESYNAGTGKFLTTGTTGAYN